MSLTHEIGFKLNGVARRANVGVDSARLRESEQAR